MFINEVMVEYIIDFGSSAVEMSERSLVKRVIIVSVLTAASLLFVAFA